MNDSDPDETKYNLYGLGFHLMGTQSYASVSVGPDDQIPGQWHFNMKTIHASPFKEADEVMKRFYDLMRARGFLKDESDEEDMGSLADSAGIEW
jgi:flagellar motor switch protein FliG